MIEALGCEDDCVLISHQSKDNRKDNRDGSEPSEKQNENRPVNIDRPMPRHQRL